MSHIWLHTSDCVPNESHGCNILSVESRLQSKRLGRMAQGGLDQLIWMPQKSDRIKDSKTLRLKILRWGLDVWGTKTHGRKFDQKLFRFLKIFGKNRMLGWGVNAWGTKKPMAGK